MQRRTALKQAAALIGGASAASLLVDAPAACAAETHKQAVSAERVAARAGLAVVETHSGRVAGYLHEGIFTFKGIPYGDTTEGANRFMPPRKPKPWAGVRSSRQYGPVSPQGARAGWAHDEEAFMFAWDDGVQAEDCLRVNVWTPAIHDGKRRPVMVWLHGGGFFAGSGQELRSYDGESLARRGDAVIVSLNHRLGAFGFLDLSSYGPQYQASGNVGMLDIVAALEWVRDNISGFGGDPGSVTLFGQSGGGGKVGALMAMPAAKGLFHRAIVESGSMPRLATREMAQRVTDQVIRELDLNPSTLARIHAVPVKQLVDAAENVLAGRRALVVGGVPDFRKLPELLGFLPVVDGTVLPAHPFDPRATQTGADIPMIIGSNLNEFVHAIDHPEYEQMAEPELEDRVRQLYGEKTPTVIAAFRRRTPDAKPFDLWSRIAAAPVRGNAIKQALAQTAAGRAKVYLYWFTWRTPILDGRPRAFHCAELPFVFDNTDRCETMTGGGPRARALAAVVSEAWLHFARTGDPNHPHMPHWEPVSASALATMIFDDKSECVSYPDAQEQASIETT
jgi:para-nitrobenzyl esterase